MKKAVAILVLIIFTLGCSESKKEIFPLYKLSLEVYPAENTFSAHLSLNYASDSLVDTATFLINKNLVIEKFYGRHLTEWKIDSIFNADRYMKIMAIFTPPLEGHQYVRITAVYHGKIDKIFDTDPHSLTSLMMRNNDYWYPQIIPTTDFFYAINVKTENNYAVGPGAHLIDGNWQIISEDATNEIQLSFNKSK